MPAPNSTGSHTNQRSCSASSRPARAARMDTRGGLAEANAPAATGRSPAPPAYATLLTHSQSTGGPQHAEHMLGKDTVEAASHHLGKRGPGATRGAATERPPSPAPA